MIFCSLTFVIVIKSTFQFFAILHIFRVVFLANLMAIRNIIPVAPTISLNLSMLLADVSNLRAKPKKSFILFLENCNFRSYG